MLSYDHQVLTSFRATMPSAVIIRTTYIPFRNELIDTGSSLTTSYLSNTLQFKSLTIS